MRNNRVAVKILINVFVFLMMSLLLRAQQSTNYALDAYVVNSQGSTCAGNSMRLLNNIGDGFVAKTDSENYALQSGLFNDFFVLAATPTVTPTATITATITLTTTAIRSFGGELIDRKWIYPAPHPIRGAVGHINIHLAEASEVEIKIYTAATNQLVISKHWDSMPAGRNVWDWNVANQPNGVFVMLITAKNGSKTSRVIKKMAVIK